MTVVCGSHFFTLPFRHSPHALLTSAFDSTPHGHRVVYAPPPPAHRLAYHSVHTADTPSRTRDHMDGCGYVTPTSAPRSGIRETHAGGYSHRQTPATEDDGGGGGGDDDDVVEDDDLRAKRGDGGGEMRLTRNGSVTEGG